jgi:hypothetical protein
MATYLFESPKKRLVISALALLKRMKLFYLNHLKVKNIARSSRKRGGGKIKQIPILIALDRSDVVSHKVLDRNAKENIPTQLKPLISSGSVLCNYVGLSYEGITEELDIVHNWLIGFNNQRVNDDFYRIKTLANYMKRWKD